MIEDANENNGAGNYRINNNKVTTSKDFDYMTKIKLKYLKYLSNSWKFLGLLLINWETWFAMAKRVCNFWNINNNCSSWKYPNLAREETIKNSGTFQITSAKLYVSIVTLSINNNIKFLVNIKQGLKRTVPWNKHKSKITTNQKTTI